MREEFILSATVAKPSDESGFTLLELSVSVVLIVALSAVCLPLLKQVDESQNGRASIDCQAIAAALVRYMQDTRLRPSGPQGRPVHNLLISDRGDMPAHSFAGSSASLDAVLSTNLFAEPRWRGPYLDALQPDPWGRRYVVLASDFHTSSPVWVLSAGVDGRVTTTAGSSALAEDDIGIQIP